MLGSEVMLLSLFLQKDDFLSALENPQKPAQKKQSSIELNSSSKSAKYEVSPADNVSNDIRQAGGCFLSAP